MRKCTAMDTHAESFSTMMPKRCIILLISNTTKTLENSFFVLPIRFLVEACNKMNFKFVISFGAIIAPLRIENPSFGSHRKRKGKKKKILQYTFKFLIRSTLRLYSTATMLIMLKILPS